MFQTQTIKSKSYSLFKGLFRDEPAQSRQAVILSKAIGNRFGGLPGDLSQVYPEAVITSSQDLGWQNIRVLHMHHADREMEVPPLENHCVILSLGPVEPKQWVSATIDGNELDRRINPGEIAIIPAGLPSHWQWHNSRPLETL